MKTYEATGKNYEEALQNGLNALHATISDVTVETLEEGSKGLFGLFGSKPCKLRLTLHEVEEEVEEDDPLADLLSSVKVEARCPAEAAAQTRAAQARTAQARTAQAGAGKARRGEGGSEGRNPGGSVRCGSCSRCDGCRPCC